MRGARLTDSACHVSAVDPLMGVGLLALPHPDDDVLDPVGTGSLHAADWAVHLSHLDGLGFEPSEDEDGEPWSHVGYLPDGRELVLLYGRQPIVTTPTVEEESQSLTELRHLIGSGAGTATAG
jgi:hypothetical protein